MQQPSELLSGGIRQFRAPRVGHRSWHWLLGLLALPFFHGIGYGASSGEIQFDVFVGYDGCVRQGAWNPVVVETFNAGPSRNAVIEVSSDRMGASTVRLPIQLPSQTRKRVTVPFFCSGAGAECRLIAEDGRILVQRTPGLTQKVGWNVPLLGSMSDSPQGGPTLPNGELGDVESSHPRVVRLRPEMFPDSALALESLSSIYVSPSKASSLRDNQVASLLEWVACGGQLVMGLDRRGDHASIPWLRTVGVPAPLGVGSLTESGMRRWLDDNSWTPVFAFRSPIGTDLPSDTRESIDPGTSRWVEPIEVLRFGSDRDEVGARIPWMSVREWGRGQVVVLGFNPEREPIRSWDQRFLFWSRLCGVSPISGANGSSQERVLTGLDVLLADIVDTHQVRRIPISILLALLVVYLAIIGPGDRWLLGRIRRPMLTWLTFPTYVLLFSGLIYLIGYRLRSGQTEWNELQIVDVIPRGVGTPSLLRCRTIGGLYSPTSTIYPLDLGVPFGGIRSELRNLFGVRLDSGQVTTTLGSQSTSAEIHASLWMKNIVVTEWIRDGQSPIGVREEGDGRYHIQNRTGGPLGPVWLVHGGRVRVVDLIEPDGLLEWRPGRDAKPLDEVLGPCLNGLSESLNRRERPPSADLVAESSEHAAVAMASGFCTSVDAAIPDRREILWPRGFDLSGPMDSGSLVVQAWVPDPGLMNPLNRFPAARGRRETLLRLVVPLQKAIPDSPSQ